MARDTSPSEKAVRREQAVLVAEAIEQLPDHYREVVIQRDFEGTTPKQIAVRMNRSPDAVCKIWARAMVKVRRLLQDRIHE